MPTLESIEAKAEPIDWESVARWLYSVLDDIDTADDHAKDNDSKYRATVNRLQRLKHEVGMSPDGQIVVFRNPPGKYGLTKLWSACTVRPWDKDK